MPPRRADRIGQAKQQLIAERDAIQKELVRLERQVRDLDNAIEALTGLGPNGAGAAPASRRPGRPRGMAASAAPAPRGRRGGPRKRREGTISAAIEDFLESQGRQAIHGDEILHHLNQLGKSPTGNNPRATLQSMLRRLSERGTVRNIGRNRWRRIRS